MTDGLMNMRDDFPRPVKEALAKRVGNKCSNPGCRAPTQGPALDSAGFVSVGIAAHITAAAPGGPRFDSTLSAEGRQSLTNGIWLCETCARKVDTDLALYDVELLRKWKNLAEVEAQRELGAPTKPSGGLPPLKFSNPEDKTLLCIQKSYLISGYEALVLPASQVDAKMYEGYEPGVDPASGRQVWLVLEEGGYIVDKHVLLVRRKDQSPGT
jgi:hypothetical protein